MASRAHPPVRSGRLFSPQLSILTAFSLFGYVRRVGYLSRKALPIKRNDAEPLTRDDVQYDLLSYIFSNDQAVFTRPSAQGTGSELVTFSDLYVSALYNSSKCSKVLKDKMTETPAFALELAKISLLTNVGRINTTMACKKSVPFCPTVH
jgi:Ino eighty subunit 1